MQASRNELLANISQTKQHVLKLQENYRSYQALFPEVKLLKWWQHIIVWFVLFMAVVYLIDFITLPFREMFNVGEPSDFLFILVVVIFTILYIFAYTKYARGKEKKAYDELNKQAGYIKGLETEKEQILYALKNSIIPENYWSVHALQSLEQYVLNQRADTLKEAINLYEQELRHDEHMRELAYLKQLQHATYQKAQEASTIGWINFFTKR